MSYAYPTLCCLNRVGVATVLPVWPLVTRKAG